MISSVTEIPKLDVIELAGQGSRASSDDQLIALWLHGRSVHTQRAYRADVARFRRRAGKPLPCVSLTDLQDFADSLGALAAASRDRILSALRSLLRSEE